mgnify:CR=1 FL=1
MPEFVFSMHNVRKKLGEKLVLDNVTLSFYEGAKIGVSKRRKPLSLKKRRTASMIVWRIFMIAVGRRERSQRWRCLKRNSWP